MRLVFSLASRINPATTNPPAVIPPASAGLPQAADEENMDFRLPEGVACPIETIGQFQRLVDAAGESTELRNKVCCRWGGAQGSD
jgi:hypothetical protein